MIYGAIAGDIIGSRFEFDAPNWRRDFDLFSSESKFTDDTVMTVAIAQALMVTPLDADEQMYKKHFTSRMQLLGKRYPTAGYGAMFDRWIHSKIPTPYNSFGNGSAMRVSAIGWRFDELDRTREVARWSAEISHNHPEGVKGAECVASMIWMARNGFSKEDMMVTAVELFDYDLSKSVDELISLHRHDETCMDTVPKALIAFNEGTDFESVIRNAVAMGGDTDTIGAVAGSIAEAMYGVPDSIIASIARRLDGYLRDQLEWIEK